MLVKWFKGSSTGQGWPIFGSLPQIWVNCKFQIWGNDPNLGQRLIFKLEIKWEDISSEYECYNDEIINLVGRLHATIRFGDWKTTAKDLYIGERNLAILGRDNFDQVGLY